MQPQWIPIHSRETRGNARAPDGRETCRSGQAERHELERPSVPATSVRGRHHECCGSTRNLTEVQQAHEMRSRESWHLDRSGEDGEPCPSGSDEGKLGVVVVSVKPGELVHEPALQNPREEVSRASHHLIDLSRKPSVLAFSVKVRILSRSSPDGTSASISRVRITSLPGIFVSCSTTASNTRWNSRTGRSDEITTVPVNRVGLVSGLRPRGVATIVPMTSRKQRDLRASVLVRSAIDGSDAWAICNHAATVAVSRLLPARGRPSVSRRE